MDRYRGDDKCEAALIESRRPGTTARFAAKAAPSCSTFSEFPMTAVSRVRSACAVLALACIVAAATIAPVTAAERGPVSKARTETAVETDARVIIKYRTDSDLMRTLAASSSGPQHAQALSTRLGLSLTDGRTMGPRTQVLRGRGLGSQELAARLSAQNDVEYAVADERKRAFAVTPNDPLYLNTTASQTPASGQWYLRASSATLVSAINAEVAWAVTTGKSSIVVADLDTGVRFDHPDLTGKLLGGYDFVSDSTTANDGGGRDSDPSDPGDWITSAEDASGAFKGCGASSSSWHGTQTAGLIGATTNNAVGMASIGRDVMVLPVRVLGKCGGYDSDIIDAMRWAAGLTVSGMNTNPNPARVINMSLGSSGSCSAAFQEAIDELVAANVIVVAAAGNDGQAVGTPANCSGVIAVAGVRHTGTKVGYSDLGSAVTISAPAGNCVNASGTCLYPILTTSNSGTSSPTTGSAGATYTSGGDDASLGTSFSAPLVSGTVALMLSADPSLKTSQVVSLLKSTARTFPSTGGGSGVSACTAPTSVAQTSECYCTTSTCGAGLLDAGAAVTAAAATATTVATAEISVASTNVVAGTSVTLDGSGSSASSGNTIVAYEWAITSGANIASITSSTTASTATVLPTAAGSVTISLTVTDSAGRTGTTSTTLSAASSSSATTSDTSSSSSSGGGATDLDSLLGLLALTIVLRWAAVRRRGD